jgi:LCP family protein required for cell wall assembly
VPAGPPDATSDATSDTPADDAVPAGPPDATSDATSDTPADAAPESPADAASAVPTAVPTGAQVAPGVASGADMLAAMGSGPATEAAADNGVPLTRKERREAATAERTRSTQTKKAKPKRTWLDWVLLTGVVLVALAILAVGSGYAYVQYRFSQVTKVTVKHLRAAPVGAPFNVLLIGSDTRAGISGADQSAYGNTSSAGGQRSDVVKIVHVVPATGQVSVLSIPRDTVVTVAGDTSQLGRYNRINATYNKGPDQLVQTIEANFGIPIAHVVQLNFIGFRGAVDAIGGVQLDFPYPARDTYTGLNITSPGCQHLNGGYSLAVARSRHYQFYAGGYWQYDGTSDFGRIQRQNAFLKALINQAEKQYNPLTLNAFIGSVVQGVTIDSTFTISELVSLAQQFRSFASTTLATATLPTYSTGSSEFGYLGSILYVQQPQANQVISQFLNGPAPVPLTPPPGPYGTVPTTTTSTLPSPSYSTGRSTPATTAPAVTTTTVQTNFDPTPC